jgi:hypothetical protein
VKRLAATAASRLAERRYAPEASLAADPEALAAAFERGGIIGALRWRARAVRPGAARPSQEQIDAVLARLWRSSSGGGRSCESAPGIDRRSAGAERAATRVGAVAEAQEALWQALQSGDLPEAYSKLRSFGACEGQCRHRR